MVSYLYKIHNSSPQLFFSKKPAYIQGLANETETLANIVLEDSCLYMHGLLADLH